MALAEDRSEHSVARDAQYHCAASFPDIAGSSSDQKPDGVGPRRELFFTLTAMAEFLLHARD